MQLKRFLGQTHWVRSVLSLTSATALSQVIIIFATPFLTRIYGIADFGSFLLTTSIASIFSAVIASSYQSAIILPEKDEDGFGVYFISIIQALICFIILYLAYITLLVLGDGTKVLLNVLQWGVYVPLLVLFGSVYQTSCSWLTRKSDFTIIAYTRYLQAISTTLITLGLGWLGFLESGLILGTVFGTTMAGITATTKVFFETRQLFKKLEYSKLKEIGAHYKDFFTTAPFSGLFNVISYQLTPIVIGSIFDSVVLGLYSLTLRVLNLPINFIGSAISQALYPRAVESERNGTLKQQIYQVAKLLSILIVIPVIVLILFGPMLFGFFFGSKWIPAGEIAQIMALFYAIRFVVSPISIVITIKRRLLFDCKFNFWFVSTQTLSLLAGAYLFQSSNISFALMSAFGFLSFFYYGLYISRLLKGEALYG